MKGSESHPRTSGLVTDPPAQSQELDQEGSQGEHGSPRGPGAVQLSKVQIPGPAQRFPSLHGEEA